MWSWSLAATKVGLRKEDQELARYARWEFGESDGAWLVSRARREATNRRRGGLRRWFASIFRAPSRSAAVARVGNSSDQGLRTANDGGDPTTPSPDECAHDGLRSLGGGGNAAYYRCHSCTHVVIAQGGTWWVLRGKK